jgi:hypothetical protein
MFNLSLGSCFLLIVLTTGAYAFKEISFRNYGDSATSASGIRVFGNKTS